jgi:hypothetical protein
MLKPSVVGHAFRQAQATENTALKNRRDLLL